MKKIHMTMACAVFALTASAQRAHGNSSFFSTDSADKGISFGIRAGVNFSDVTADDSKMRTGFHAGVAVDFPIVESLYVQSELYYTVKGFKSESNVEYSDSYVNAYEDYERNANIGYLEIPVLASYRYNFNASTQLQFNIGPYFAYGLHGKDKQEWVTSSWSRYGYDDVEIEKEENKWFDYSDTKRFDVGLHIGLGLTFARNYYVGIAYEEGFTEIADDTNWKNANLQISLGYQF